MFGKVRSFNEVDFIKFSKKLNVDEDKVGEILETLEKNKIIEKRYNFK